MPAHGTRRHRDAAATGHDAGFMVVGQASLCLPIPMPAHTMPAHPIPAHGTRRHRDAAATGDDAGFMVVGQASLCLPIPMPAHPHACPFYACPVPTHVRTSAERLASPQSLSPAARLAGSFRDATSRRIAASSSAVTVRKCIHLGILFLLTLSGELHPIHLARKPLNRFVKCGKTRIMKRA